MAQVLSRSKTSLRPDNELLQDIWHSWRPGICRKVSKWADKYRILSRLASSEPGRWKTSRVPYLREVMDAFSDPKVRMIVLKWGTQLGKTEVILNSLGWVIDESPGPVLIVYDTEKTLKKVSTTRIQPMIESCPRLRDKKHPSADKFKLEEMHFHDCVIYLASAQSPGSLASTPIEYVFCDEVARYPTYAKEEGDPVELAMERQKTFMYTKKTVLTSSPTVKEGTISRFFEDCEEKLTYWVPCPHCGSYQVLEFEQLRWDKELEKKGKNEGVMRLIRDSAYYECIHCKEKITDQHKNRMLKDGTWARMDGSKPNRHAESLGFWISSLYSPFLLFGDVVVKYLKVKDDPARHRVFVNGWLAKEWEEPPVVKVDPVEILKTNRTNLPPRLVPKGTICLTMGIDTQAYGFYFVVRAWKRDKTSQLVEFGLAPSFKDLEEIIFNRTYPVEGSEERMRVWRAAIDTGGTALDQGFTMTEAIYDWLRHNSRGVVFGVKGQSHKGAKRVKMTVIDKLPSGKALIGGLTLFLIDTDAFKEALHYRLKLKSDEPGAFLFHRDVSDKYMKQLLSEEKRRDSKTGKEKWVKVNRENHALDCEIYAMACVDAEWLGGIEVLSKPMQMETKNRQEASPRTANKAGALVTHQTWLGRTTNWL